MLASARDAEVLDYLKAKLKIEQHERQNKEARNAGRSRISGPEPERSGARECRPAGQRSAEPAIGSERTAFFPTFGEEERLRSFRADGYRLSRRLAGRRPAGRRRRALQERGTMRCRRTAETRCSTRGICRGRETPNSRDCWQRSRRRWQCSIARGGGRNGRPRAQPPFRGGGQRESADARGVPSAEAEHAASRGAVTRRRGKKLPPADGEAGRGGEGAGDQRES